MKRDTTSSLRIIKYSAIAVSAMMVGGIAALMILARGKEEDIASIVGPALLITTVSGAVAIIAAILQKRAQKANDTEDGRELRKQNVR